MDLGGSFQRKNGGTPEKKAAQKPSAIPVLNQVIKTATSGATCALSGIGRHLNDSMRNIVAKNIGAGIASGVGFDHGLKVGLGSKVGVMHQIQWHILGAMTKLMMKFGAGPNLSIDQRALPASMQRGMSIVRGSSSQDPLGNIMQLGKNIPNVVNQGIAGDNKVKTGTESSVSESAPLNLSFGTRSEKLTNNVLKDPVLRGEDTELREQVLKHQRVIDELIGEIERVRRVLAEDLKVPPSKLQTSYSGKNRSSSGDCFKRQQKE